MANDKSPETALNGTALTPRQLEKRPQADISLDDILLEDSKLDQEVALLVSQYLRSRSYGHIAQIIDEQILNQPADARREEVLDVERAINDGDYGSIEGLLARPGLLKPQTQKGFLYMCYRQQFLEHVENRESQKAFNLLQKRLKPLEHYQPIPYDFFSLSYLTSASTVHDAPSFKDWAGVEPEREKLVKMWRELIASEHLRPLSDNADITGGAAANLKDGRLVELLRQAGAWQIERARSKGKAPWKINSLLQDYHPISLPTHLMQLVSLHQANIKCVTFLTPDGSIAASGSSDTTIQIFSTENGAVRHTLRGHSSRIWDIDSSAAGIASASGDGTVRIWSNEGEARGVLGGDAGDVYGVRWRPNRQDELTTACYDRILRAYSVETGQLIRTFSGHALSCLSVAFDPTGNLVASGSKDKHMRLWDAVGGVCITTMTGCLGEVTSVEFDDHGRYVLAGCKDNSNRLWDLRMQRNLFRYTGHQNTSKNLIRCSFAQQSSLIVGGSEDGRIYIWEREGGTSPSAAADPLTSTSSGGTAIKPDGTSGQQFTTPVMTATLGVPPSNSSYSSTSPRASPAYYPKPSQAAHVALSSGANIRPLRVLEAHDNGAVFDVRWRAGMMLSGGEDGSVGIWDGSSEKKPA